MADEPQKPRLCQACGKDCTGQPRIKDKKGRYLHKACYEKAQAKRQAAKAAEQSDDAGLGVGLGAGAFDEIEQVQMDTRPCPDCGSPASADAVLCTGCGHSFVTGESGSNATVTKPSKMAGVAEGAADKFRSTVSSGFMGWVVTLGLPLVVGLVCSIAWAWATLSLGYSVGIFVLAIGVIIGLTMRFVSGGGGFTAGVISAALTVCAIGMGIVIIDSTITGESLVSEYKDPLADVVTANDAKFRIADWIAYEREENGETLDWPSGKHFYTAEFMSDFPSDIASEANRRWKAMEGYEQHEARADVLFSEHDAIVEHAERIVMTRYENGQDVQWPTLQGSEYGAYYPRDYPQDIWSEATNAWNERQPSEQTDYIARRRREVNQLYEQFAELLPVDTTETRSMYRFMRGIFGSAFVAFLMVFKD